jgi:hypothetical protein
MMDRSFHLPRMLIAHPLCEAINNENTCSQSNTNSARIRAKSSLPERDDGEQFFRRVCVRELPVSDVRLSVSFSC